MQNLNVMEKRALIKEIGQHLEEFIRPELVGDVLKSEPAAGSTFLNKKNWIGKLLGAHVPDEAEDAKLMFHSALQNPNISRDELKQTSDRFNKIMKARNGQ